MSSKNLPPPPQHPVLLQTSSSDLPSFSRHVLEPPMTSVLSQFDGPCLQTGGASPASAGCAASPQLRRRHAACSPCSSSPVSPPAENSLVITEAADRSCQTDGTGRPDRQLVLLTSILGFSSVPGGRLLPLSQHLALLPIPAAF